MRNRAIVIGLSCWVLASAAAAVGDFPDVKQRGSLRVLCVADADSARYFSLDPKRPGFDHEVLLGFARLHEVVLELVVVEGEDLLVRYQSSPGQTRAFCRVCGSSLPDPDPGATDFYLPAGTLDGDPGARPAAHIFVGSKAPWCEITDELPQFDEYPPGFGT